MCKVAVRARWCVCARRGGRGLHTRTLQDLPDFFFGWVGARRAHDLQQRVRVSGSATAGKAGPGRGHQRRWQVARREEGVYLAELLALDFARLVLVQFEHFLAQRLVFCALRRKKHSAQHTASARRVWPAGVHRLHVWRCGGDYCQYDTMGSIAT